MQGMWGIVLALVLLMALAYRGYSVLLLAPLCALVAVLSSGDVPLASYAQVFMPALGGFVVAFFPLFLLGAVFGRLMEASGAALAIARGLADRLGAGQAVLAVVAACAVLTYGGVSLFVVAFAVHPIAVALFMRAGHSRRLIPATIALGAFTFTMTALPGTPAIQNAIPMPFFGTTPFAAPGLGLIGAVIMLAAGWAWIEWRVRRVRDEVEPADEGAAEAAPAPLPGPAMSLGPALLPVLMVIVLNYLLSILVLACGRYRLSGRVPLWRHHAAGGQRRLVGHRRARGGHRPADRPAVACTTPPAACAVPAAEGGARGGGTGVRDAADEHGIPGGFRRGDRLPGRFCADPGGGHGAVGREPPGVDVDRDQSAGGHDGFRVGRHEHRAGTLGQNWLEMAHAVQASRRNCCTGSRRSPPADSMPCRTTVR